MQMILKSMGVKVDKDDMESHCADVDEEATGKFSFHMFCQVAARFMIEDDEEQMKEELMKKRLENFLSICFAKLLQDL